jgi:hypothetical protein
MIILNNSTYLSQQSQNISFDENDIIFPFGIDERPLNGDDVIIQKSGDMLFNKIKGLYILCYNPFRNNIEITLPFNMGFGSTNIQENNWTISLWLSVVNQYKNIFFFYGNVVNSTYEDKENTDNLKLRLYCAGNNVWLDGNTTFGDWDTIIYPFASYTDIPFHIVILSNGKIYLNGQYHTSREFTEISEFINKFYIGCLGITDNSSYYANISNLIFSNNIWSTNKIEYVYNLGDKPYTETDEQTFSYIGEGEIKFDILSGYNNGKYPPQRVDTLWDGIIGKPWNEDWAYGYGYPQGRIEFIIEEEGYLYVCTSSSYYNISTYISSSPDETILINQSFGGYPNTWHKINYLLQANTPYYFFCDIDQCIAEWKFMKS